MKMSLDTKVYTIILVCGIIIWFNQNLTLDIDYERHAQLKDPKTNQTIKPSQLLDLGKVINITDQYINSTNAQDRLHDLVYTMNFESPFLIDYNYTNLQELKQSGYPVSNKTKCKDDLDWIIKMFDKYENYTQVKGRIGYELTNLIDSFGKFESNSFSGLTNWLGSYKSCLKVTLNNNSIKTRYCIGRMKFKSWPADERIIPKTVIRLGLCIPETCTTRSFSRPLAAEMIEKLSKIDLPSRYQEELQLDSIYCLPDERSPIRRLPTGGFIYIGVVSAWVLIIIVATITHEHLIRNHPRRKSMSVKQEIDKLKNQALFYLAKGFQQAQPQQESTPQLSPEPSPQLSRNLTTLDVSDISNNSSEYSYGSYTFVDDNNTDNSNNNPVTDAQQSGFLGTLVNDVLLALSLRSTINDFKTDSFKVKHNRYNKVRVHLGSLDFFKVAFAIAIVLAHSAYLSSIYSRSLGNRVDTNISPLGKLSLSLAKFVDTFFVFFGILTTYTMLRKFNTKELGNPYTWLFVNIGVFLRITPLFMLVYWYSKTISPYTGSGPWWDYGTDKYSMKGVCMADPWWKSIPYFGSLGSPSVPACNLPSWFIVSYSQISLLLPLITYLIYSLQGFIAKLSLVLFLLCASAFNIGARLYMQTTIREEGFTLYGGFLSDLLEKFESTGHISTLGRIGSVAVGCFVGYLLYSYEEKKINNWPSWLKSTKVCLFTALIHIAILFLPIIGHYIYEYNRNLVTLEQFVGVNVALIIVWPILNAILLINITTVNNHSILIRFLRHSFWHIFNRLGLCIFLVHWEVIFIGITSYEQGPDYLFVTDVMKTWAFGLYVSILLAFAIHVFIESPVSRLTTVLIKYLSGHGSKINSDNSRNHINFNTKKTKVQFYN